MKTAKILQIWRSFVPAIARCLKTSIAWPDFGAVRWTLRKCFEKKIRDCICIMDCSEIFIDRPKNLTARGQTWLNYNHNNTSKYLVWVLATVLISFISCGRSGLISDKQKALQPGFLKRFTFGDLILADRGFKLHDEIASADTRFHERKVTVIAMCSGYFKRTF